MLKHPRLPVNLVIRNPMFRGKTCKYCVAGVLGMSLAALLPAATATRTNTVQPTISAAGDLSVPAASTLTLGASAFSNYTATVTVQYHARTTSAGTTSAITMQASGDFTATHPSIAAGDLTYTCGAAGLGTPCSGTVTASTGAAQTIVTIGAATCTGGGGACSGSSPNTMAVNFALANLPAAVTGTYTANMLFTISAN